MYNRYIRNDRGTYTRIPEDEPSRHNSPDSRTAQETPPPQQQDPPRSSNQQSDVRQSKDATASRQEHSSYSEPVSSSRTPVVSSASSRGDMITRTLRSVLDRFHLEHVDTGDLLLLVVLFLLFEENADEELLFALGLLLIL